MSDKEQKYIVVRNLNNDSDCRVFPENATYPAIYSKVYGPASKADCDKYVAENCGTAQ